MPDETTPAVQEDAPIEIRRMTIEDLAPVARLGERLFTLRKWPTLYRTWDEFEVVGRYNSEPQCCFVAVRKDRVVGFLLGTIVEKRPPACRYGYLEWIGVAPRCAGQGVGKRLCDEFVRYVQQEGVHMLLVDTEADNADAIRFFEHRGFGRPEAHVYMSMKLDDSEERPRKRRTPPGDRGQ